MADLFQVVGNVVGGIAGYETGKYNAAVAETEAVDAERDGTVDEARIRDAARLAIGQQVAAQGENGFQQGTGSALDALQQSQINATLDALTVRRAAASKARSLRVSGAIAKAKGENDLLVGMLGAASSAAGSQGDWASAKSGQSSGGYGGYGGGSKSTGNTAKAG